MPINDKGFVPANITPEQMPKMEAALTAAWKLQAERRAAKERAEDEELDRSYASAFLCEFRERRGEYFQPLAVESPTGVRLECGVKSISFAEYLEAGVDMARSGFTISDMTNAGAQVALYASLFHVGLTEFGDENKRLFGHPDEAKAWMHEPGMVEIPLLVRSVLFDLNEPLKKVFRPEEDHLGILLAGQVESSAEAVSR